MTRADSNVAELRYAAEASWGTTPAGIPMTTLRHTGEGLERIKTTQVSNEVRDDRQVSDLVETGVRTTGPVNFELIYGEYEPFLAAALASAISSGAVIGSNIIAIAASTIRASTGLWASEGFAAGQYIKVKGSAAANVNAVAKVVSILNASTLSITGTTLAVETPGAGHSVVHRTLRNGVTKTQSFVFERVLEDIDQFQWFNGQQVAGVTLNINAGQIITGVFEFMGKTSEGASTTIASGTPAAPTSNEIMAAGVDIADVMEGGAEFVTGIQSLTLRIAGNLRTQPEIRRKTPLGHGFGRFEVTGNMTAYFENRALMEKFENHTQSSVSVRFRDRDGNDILITIPAMKYGRANAPIPGVNQDVMLPVEFTGYRDPVTGCTMQIDMLPA